MAAALQFAGSYLAQGLKNAEPLSPMPSHTDTGLFAIILTFLMRATLWIVTNPPFRLAEYFVQRSLVVASLRAPSSSRVLVDIAIFSNTILPPNLLSTRNVFRWCVVASIGKRRQQLDMPGWCESPAQVQHASCGAPVPQGFGARYQLSVDLSASLSGISSPNRHSEIAHFRTLEHLS